ncbi:MAG: glycosyltransferase family 1 protein [Candidatus Shapirobacteria bacterium]|nr:glycosyltransferase family 1 protein [Candidatus Shapirobacteria bacterium]MDD4410490.1 glycosyltransferase family 1 protein [Candidatus Shapirobacteria bacterium]
MLIGIDGNEANITSRVGVGQYAFNLLKNLYLIDKKNQYIIYLKNPPLSDLPKENKNWRYKVFGPQKLWTRFALPIHLFTEKTPLDLFYSPSHYSPAFAPCPTIPTIHDLGYLQFQSQFTKKDLYQLINWTKQSIKKASHIITVSNFSKTEIEKIYKINPKKITIAFNGVDEPLKINSKDQQKILSSFNLVSKNYYLYLGTLKPNKNIPFLIKSFAQYLKQKEISSLHQGRMSEGQVGLVIAGKKGWLFDEIFSAVKQEGIESNIVFTDFIDDIQKTTLYSNAKALIIPSTYEGFGIPVIEAMKLDTPVISSNIAPLKEVIQSNGFYFDPTNQKELVDQLIKFENSKPSEIEKIVKSAKIRADFFSWKNTAKSVISVFEKFKK